MIFFKKNATMYEKKFINMIFCHKKCLIHLRKIYNDCRVPIPNPNQLII